MKSGHLLGARSGLKPLKQSFSNMLMRIVNRNLFAENAADAIDVAERKLGEAAHDGSGLFKLDSLNVSFEIALRVCIVEAVRVFRIVASAECSVAGLPHELNCFIE